MTKSRCVNQSNQWERHPLFSLSALCFLLASQAAQGFCPNNGLKCGFGAAGTTHKDMTKRAVEELDQEFFGTDRLTKSMKNAIEEIWKANSDVDLNQASGFWHFDGESFEVAKNKRIVPLMQGVIQSLEAEDGSGARSQLGQALHTIQDFYSHTNFIESGGRGANPAIWRADTPFPPVPGPFEPTCRDCEFVVDPLGGPPTLDCTTNIITPLLTSGYFGGENETPKIDGKCRHGGAFDSGSGPLGGINKDVFLALFSPHSFYHFPAASSAQEATKQFIRDIKDRITERQLKLLLGVGPTLAMAVDTTGSMGSVISQVRTQAIQIVDQRIGTDQEPLKYVLSPFNDPSVGPLTVTDDPDQFKAAIRALFASGGGDCPELSMAGQIAALSAADNGVDLFTFTDADAKDAGRAATVSSLAASKDAKIFPILNGACSFSFFSDPSPADDEAAQFDAAVFAPDSANGASSQFSVAAFGPNIDPAYRRIANDSGGQVFVLNTTEVGQVTRLADAAVRANSVDLLSVADVLSGGKSFSVPVDSSLERVTFSLSGVSSLVLTRPDGTTVVPGDPGVTAIPLSTGSIFTLLAPLPGDWIATISGSGAFSLNVLGESPVDLDRFDFVELAGRLAHEGLFDLEGFPVVGTTTTAAAELSGDIATASFELRTKQGESIAVLDLATEDQGDPNEFFGEVNLPTTPFLAYATGTLSNGESYQRALTTVIQPQTVRIFAPAAEALVPGQVLEYVFEVKNFGAANDFRFTASDDQGFLRQVAPTRFRLAEGASLAVTVELQAPVGTDASSDTLTATVESTAPAGARNFAVVRSLVSLTSTVDCSLAEPSTASLWPPNHGFVPVDIVGVTSTDGSAVQIRIDTILQSEPPLAPGEGDTCPDARGLGTPQAELRAERNGTGGGRVYSVSYTAFSAAGGTCTGSVEVCVPHDQGGDCVAAAATIDSTTCP